jgi:hypothetical protein
MSGVEVVRNRPPSFKVWLERFGSDSRALRDRKNLRKVRYELEGNSIPRELHGAELATTTDTSYRFEQWHDRQFLRPPGSCSYRAASAFTGPGVFDEAARRAKFNVCFGAEIDEQYRDSYYHNTGVRPYDSNEAILAVLEMVSDLVEDDGC